MKTTKIIPSEYAQWARKGPNMFQRFLELSMDKAGFDPNGAPPKIKHSKHTGVITITQAEEDDINKEMGYIKNGKIVDKKPDPEEEGWEKKIIVVNKDVLPDKYIKAKS